MSWIRCAVHSGPRAPEPLPTPSRLTPDRCQTKTSRLPKKASVCPGRGSLLRNALAFWTPHMNPGMPLSSGDQARKSTTLVENFGGGSREIFPDAVASMPPGPTQRARRRLSFEWEPRYGVRPPNPF